MKTVTVIGLGSMGWGAGRHLVNAGFTTYGVDIRDDVLQKFNDLGGHGTDDCGYALAQSDAVIVYLVNAQQVRTVLLGDGGCAKQAKAGTIFILCATMPPNETMAIAHELQQAGMRVLDAPVSGGVTGATDGTLTIMGAGEDAVFDEAEPVLGAISAKVYRLGNTVGVGSKMKMLNQLLAGVHLATMGEAMALAKRMDMDLATVHDIILQSAGGSWMMDHRGGCVVSGKYDSGSAIDIWPKDLGIVCGEAEQVDFTPTITQAALELFKEASEAGMGTLDDANIAKWIAEKNGFTMEKK